MSISQDPKSKPVKIREVWASNLEYEFKLMSSLIESFPFISMDTEFPGVVYKAPEASNRHRGSDLLYRLLKSNVDVLSLIQVGLTLTDSNGNLPDLSTDSSYIWEFNFRDFDVARHPHAPDSIDLLRRQGTDFARNRSQGVDSRRFAELMMSSGLVCNQSVSWVTFHSAYDFGYLVKILTRRKLPGRVQDFLGLVRAFFGNRVYDVKYLMRHCNSLYGGLDRLANTLSLHRLVGNSHQAGSDSLLTWHAFHKITHIYFLDHAPDMYAGVLYGFEGFPIQIQLPHIIY